MYRASIYTGTLKKTTNGKPDLSNLSLIIRHETLDLKTLQGYVSESIGNVSTTWMYFENESFKSINCFIDGKHYQGIYTDQGRTYLTVIENMERSKNE